jgi:hypothetical protein
VSLSLELIEGVLVPILAHLVGIVAHQLMEVVELRGVECVLCFEALAEHVDELIKRRQRSLHRPSRLDADRRGGEGCQARLGVTPDGAGSKDRTTLLEVLAPKISRRWSLYHDAVSRKARTVAGALPGSVGRVPANDAAEMSAACG